ncbi:FAD-dependent oxidoreductase [Sulfurimonas sp.]|uniref:FAD-dependent oxidoreductase n=1 Tax=Sulfurimonas sp. TaxID=2022749 RepID=UPI002B4696B3|nr:FAD-dependent oxidoreductase [Sulfurimonas sp.]
MLKCDVLVVGAGGAGLVSAIKAHENGSKVVVITKEYPTRSQTCMAQGGINAAFGNAGDDSVEAHIQNTLKSAHGLADEKAIRFLCENAKEAVEWLDSLGVCFSRTQDAKIAQRTLGGASASRACYAQDYTGLKILHTLYDVCLGLGIEILNERYLLDFCVDANMICGANILNIRSGEQEYYSAKSVIVATGGYSRIYSKYSTNSTATTGDGIASAIRAGAKVSDMEFVQFHPTALKNSSILISESARGAGGLLLNSKNKRFVDELLPRDEVARAINDEISKGEEIFLDIRHLGENFIDTQLPQERKLAKLYENIDPVYDLIPIKPVAHYTMGGIEVDDNTMTNIKGLFAVGECANHRVHGANRLGGNSLLELIVFGKQAGKSASKFALGVDAQRICKEQVSLEIFFKKPSFDFYKIKEQLASSFYENVGISRDGDGLQKVFDEVEVYKSQLADMGVEDNSKIYNTNLVEFLEFKNMLELASLVLNSAMQRKESRGSHFRTDFPQENGVKK